MPCDQAQHRDHCIDAVSWSNSCQGCGAAGPQNMSHSLTPKRRNKVAPVLGAAGLSVALAGAASAATGAPAALMLTPNNGASHESTLDEEAIFDVTLATFPVVNKETAGTFRPARRLAMGGGCGGGCAGCAGWSANYGASPERDAGLQQHPIKATHPPKRRHVPKSP